MKFVRLTDVDETGIIVNVEQVQYVYKDNKGTMVVFNDRLLCVKESMEQVQLMLR